MYRATGETGDFAIKFTMRDERNRARREYQTLGVLQQAGLSLAPEPVLLDETRYLQPVVVQTWLEGAVHDSPPTSDREWQHLIDHYAGIHRLTPDCTGANLPHSVQNAGSVAQCVELVRSQMMRLPQPPAELQNLVDRLESSDFPDWPTPVNALCRTDPNIMNFIHRRDSWASVDWEGSGWGDPAFEIADLMVHPAYMSVSPERWDWMIEQYASQSADSEVSLRIKTYYRILAVWWVARMARYLYEIPRGLDQRLVERPDDWLVQARQKYDHYLNLAENLMER